jgi:hypothetical protein
MFRKMKPLLAEIPSHSLNFVVYRPARSREIVQSAPDLQNTLSLEFMEI